MTATTSAINLGPGLELSTDAVTQVIAILAKRGAGKTTTARVLVEEMVVVGGKVVVLDPLGAWWGLRSSANGKKEGLPFIIIGGDHADVPLEPSAGNVVANLVATQNVLVVIDMSGFDTDADKIMFAADFLDTLYRVNRTPLHVVMEEADEFAPESPPRNAKRMTTAADRLVRRGRQRGIGVTLITQRSAALAKGVLTQADILLAMRTTAPQDRKAVEAWIDRQGDPELRAEVINTLAKLPTGTAWVWAPDDDILTRVQVRPGRTFDSGSTPKLGTSTATPGRWASIDVSALTSAMADTIERAEADNPDRLRSRITALESELAAALAADPAPEPVEVRVEVVPPATAEAVAELAAAAASIETIASAITAAAHDLTETAATASDLAADATTTITAATNTAATNTALVVPGPAGAHHTTPTPQPPPSTANTPGSATPPRRVQSKNPDTTLGKAERAILATLATAHPNPTPMGRLALLAGYSATGGGFRNALSRLRTLNYITGSGDPGMTATTEGLDAVGDWEPLPTGDALIAYWRNHQRLGKAEREILDTLLNAWPEGLTTENLAAGTLSNYSATGGGFRNALSTLRTLGLITGSRNTPINVSDTLGQAKPR